MLKLAWSDSSPLPRPRDLLVLPVRACDVDDGRLDDLVSLKVAAACAAADFRGKPGQRFELSLPTDDGIHHVLLLGCGEGPRTPQEIRTLSCEASRRAVELGSQRLVLSLRTVASAPTGPALGSLVAQGCLLGTYRYERFLSEDGRREVHLDEIVIVSGDAAALDGLGRGRAIAGAVARARDLANGPAELVTPTHLAQVAQEIAANNKEGVTLKVLEREDCEKLGMGLYLAVAKGSDAPPKFIHLTYRPTGTPRGRVVLIGKGVTFDSGGYSLKPSDGMLDMKMDMAGAAAVLGAFEGAAALAVPYEVHAIVAATENMVSGHAYRLGDVFHASNGKSVEINNTDAEGRLTLADALVYGSKLEPDLMVDFATLTGACMVALGPHIAGVMTPDEPLAQAWMSASEASGESMWRLPLPPDLKEQLKSKIADMKNTGLRWGGALTAGLFLSEFVGDKRWMHVDIAGPAMADKPSGVTTAGGTGFAVATILEFLARDELPAAPPSN